MVHNTFDNKNVSIVIYKDKTRNMTVARRFEGRL